MNYETQVNSFVAASTVTNNALLTYTGLAAPVSTSVNVTVTAAYAVVIDVYNEAGELVKQLLQQQYSQPINNISLQAGASITSLAGANNAVSIYDGSHYITSWDGTSSNGSLVSNGNYYVKVENTDTLGVVTTEVQTVTVSRQLETVSVKIYNEAGEVVRTLSTVISDAQASQLNLTQLSSTVIQPGSPGANGQLEIVLSNGVSLTWDGRGDNGQVVTNGEYYLTINATNGMGGNTVIARTVMVENGHNTNNQIFAYPNSVVDGAGPVTFSINPATPQTLSVRIYDVAGELVTAPVGPAGGNYAVWDPSGKASGVYIARVKAVETSSGNVTAQQTLKILIRH